MWQRKKLFHNRKRVTTGVVQTRRAEIHWSRVRATSAPGPRVPERWEPPCLGGSGRCDVGTGREWRQPEVTAHLRSAPGFGSAVENRDHIFASTVRARRIRPPS
jgi:hypothetical protein